MTEELKEKENKKNILKSILIMSSSSWLSKLISFPAGIIVARKLGPDLFGQYAFLIVFLQYAGHSHLGMIQCLTRNIPIHLAQNNLNESKKVESLTFTFLLFMSILVIILSWILFGFKILPPVFTFWRLLLLTFIFIANRMNSYLRCYAKAIGTFTLMGQSDLLQSLIQPLLNVILVVFFGLEGLLISSLASEISAISLYVLSLKKLSLKIIFNLKETIVLLRMGILIYLNKMLDSLLQGINVLFSSTFLTSYYAGLISYAIGPQSLALPFGGSIQNVVYRNLLMDYGKHAFKDKTKLHKYTTEILTGYLYIMTLLLSFASLAYFLLIDLFLQKYELSKLIIVLINFGFFFYQARDFIIFYLNITAQFYKRLFFLSIGIIFNILLNYIFIKQGWGIIGIAIVYSLTLFFLTVEFIFVCFKQIHNNYSKAFYLLFKILLIALSITATLYWFSSFDFFALRDNYFMMYTLKILSSAIKCLIIFAEITALFIILFGKINTFESITPYFSLIRDRFFNKKVTVNV